MTKSIKKSFLLDPLTTNNSIYRDSLTLISIISSLNQGSISESYIKVKINLIFYFRTSLWCLKRLT